MTAVVCIPWHNSGDPYRRAAFEYVYRWWQLHGYPVSAPYDGPEFNISSARNLAANRAIGDGAAELIFADADTVPEIEPVQIAVLEARICPGVIYPHDRYHSLGQTATDDLIRNGKWPPCYEWPWTEGPPNRVSVSGVVVCSVASWAAIGGWDEQFTEWGGEDVAFALMARDVLGRALRMPGNVWHLWHPRDGYPRTRSESHDARLAAYRAAALEGPHALRALRGLDEAPL